MNARVSTHKPATKPANKPAKSAPAKGWTAEEKAAMRERAKELKAVESREEAEKAVIAKIAAMKEPDRSMAKRIHAIVKADAPILATRLWYGSPAYTRNSEVIFYFQESTKFKVRYGLLGFSDKAHLDDGNMWPVAYALKALLPADGTRITALIRKALSNSVEKQEQKPEREFTAEEKAAMRERTKEETSESGEDAEKALLAKIAEMKDSDRAMAERIHAIVKANAPDLAPRLWYGSPAYYKDGKMICFFQERSKFKVRYGNLGFSDKAHLDEGNMWPVAYAILELTPAEEARIAELIKKAAS